MLTQFGRETLLGMALRDSSTSLYVGLCDAEYSETLQLEDITEPTIGVNGYARIGIGRDALGWPGDGLVNNEVYFESDWLTWTASGGDFDAAIQRMFVCTDATATTGDLIALGGALADPITITPTTPEADRKFKFRFYAR